LTVAPAANSVEDAKERIRELILSRQLLPGQQIRQEELARSMNISRSPVREALQSLQSEGAVAHYPHRGYFVTRLSAPEIEQIYLMRRLLETEVLRRCEWPAPQRLNRLRKLNNQMEAAAERNEIHEIVALNRAFHFEIFSLSSLEIVVSELSRLWTLSDPYRFLYLWDTSAQSRSSREHTEIIAALRTRDRKQLISITDAHRQVGERKLLALLSDADRPPDGSRRRRS
jgi:DNA-binding GntR family transcriptional regulator